MQTKKPELFVHDMTTGNIKIANTKHQDLFLEHEVLRLEKHSTLLIKKCVVFHVSFKTFSQKVTVFLFCCSFF